MKATTATTTTTAKAATTTMMNAYDFQLRLVPKSLSWIGDNDDYDDDDEVRWLATDLAAVTLVEEVATLLTPRRG